MKPREPKSAPESDLIKGWQQIAAFLGQPISVVQRWAESGMPIEKHGRYVYSSRQKLESWLGRESAGGPVHLPEKDNDLTAELRRGLSYMREQKRNRSATKQAV